MYRHSDTLSSNNIIGQLCLLNDEEGSLGSKIVSYCRLSQSAYPVWQTFERRGKGGAQELRRLQST